MLGPRISQPMRVCFHRKLLKKFVGSLFWDVQDVVLESIPFTASIIDEVRDAHKPSFEVG